MHICGLGASVGCERLSEHSTRRDENHKYALLDSQVSSTLTLLQIKISRRYFMKHSRLSKKSRWTALIFSLLLGLTSIFAPNASISVEAKSTKTPATTHGRLSVKETNIVDSKGKKFQLRGVSTHGINWDVGCPYANQVEAEKEMNESDSPVQIKDIKVLLVEDNELNMEIATELLNEKGAIITQAENGAEAVQLFKESLKGTFDVILMEINI